MQAANWREFESRFGGSSSRRVRLSGRLRALLQLAATSGKLRRVFIRGSFVEDFEAGGVAAPAQAVFISARAKLLFEWNNR